MNLKHKIIISDKIYSILTIQKKKSYEIRSKYVYIQEKKRVQSTLICRKEKVIADYCFNHKPSRHYKPHREIYLHPPKITLNINFDFNKK